MNYILKTEYYEATFSTRGAEMVSLKNAAGQELLWQNNMGKGWSDHAPILFPFCGGMLDKTTYYKNVAYPVMQHGLALRTEFTLVEQTATSITFVLTETEETLAQYPFAFKLTVTYTFEGAKITLAASVDNTGSDVLPYSFGWHPGFVLFTDKGQDIEDYCLKFDNVDQLTWVRYHKGYHIPNDLIPYPLKDSAYHVCEKEIYDQDTMVFLGAGTKATLTADGYPYALEMAWSENIPSLCIWKMANHDAKFLCIEPWTHATIRGEKCNHWEHREAHRLAPGQSENFVYTLQFKF